ncbi:hypothetical protein V8C35DRAFT_315253 [Trichoderma chlorosporum]
MESQIAPLVNRSLASLKNFSDLVSSSQEEYSIARSHLSRFKLWAGSLGAHRSSGGRSLEYRLRDSSFVRNHIVSLLQELVASIDEGTRLATAGGDDKNALNDASDDTITDLESYFQSDEQSDFMVILDDIGHIIDCLLRLSITIRNPAPHDQFNSRAGVDIVSSYKQWDVNHIRENFNKLDSQLVDRLGMAMSRRRQYLKYRDEHSKKLAQGLLAEADEGDKATTVASSIPKHLKDADNPDFLHELDTLFESMSEISGTSYASSTTTTNELRVPNIPKDYVNGPFQCPFCQMLIMVNDRSQWKKHVFRDLQPYVCLFDNCSVPSQLYQRRADWAAHMKQEHWVSWSCSFGCSGSFDTQQGFKGHLMTVHAQNDKSIDLQAVMNLSRFPNDKRIIGTCPLCLDYQIQSSKRYQSHVGDHLERLALFVLPHTAYDTSDDEDEDGNRNYDQKPYGDDSSESEEPEEVRIGQMNIDPSRQEDSDVDFKEMKHPLGSISRSSLELNPEERADETENTYRHADLIAHKRKDKEQTDVPYEPTPYEPYEPTGYEDVPYDPSLASSNVINLEGSTDEIKKANADLTARDIVDSYPEEYRTSLDPLQRQVAEQQAAHKQQISASHNPAQHMGMNAQPMPGMPQQNPTAAAAQTQMGAQQQQAIMDRRVRETDEAVKNSEHERAEASGIAAFESGDEEKDG